MSSSIRIAGRLGLFILLGCIPAFGESVRESESLSDTASITYRLEEVVITGDRNAIRSTMSDVTTAEEISRRRSESIAEFLRLNPSLSVVSGAKAETETRLRGFPAHDVLVLVDGRPISPGYYGKVDLSMLAVENIAKIGVLKGPASVAYGPNSMGGVVEIVTQNGSEQPRTVLSSEFGDYRTRRLSLNHSRQVGKWNYWLSGYEHHSDGFALSEDFEATSLEAGGLRDHSGSYRVGGDGKLGVRTSATDVYAVSLGYHYAEKDVPTTIFGWDSPTFRTFPSYERFNSSISGSRQVAENLELKSVVFVDGYFDRLIDYSGPGMTDDQVVWDSKLENWTVGGSLDGVMRRGRFHNLQAGLAVKRDLMNKQPDLDEPWTTHVLRTGSVYMQDQITVGEKTDATAGVGVSTFDAEAANSRRTNFTPMLSVERELPWELRFEASFARTVRYPTLHWLYGETSGNPDLKPERAEKWEAGVSRQFASRGSSHCVSLGASYFYNDLRDLVYRDSRDDVYRNIGRAELQGWEIETEIKLSQRVRSAISFARMEPERSSDELMQEVSPNRLNVVVSVDTRFGMQATYELNTFDNRSTHVTGTTLYPYELHHLTISQRISQHFEAHLKGRNLTDTDYSEELGYPGPGRQICGGVTASL